MKIKPIILAAGKGSRMHSDRPKVMHKVGGKAMLHHVVTTCKSLSGGMIVGVVGHHAAVVIESFPVDSNIVWVHQEQQLGTGHAVIQAIPEIDDDDVVLIAYGDVPLVKAETLKPLCECINKHELALLTTQLEDPLGYGRIVRNSKNEILKIVEEKDASDEIRNINEINTGIMAAKGSSLKSWLAKLSNDNAQGEYYLTDCVAQAVEDGASITSVNCSNPAEIQGVNNRHQQAMLERAYQLGQAESLMDNGVTLADPARFDVRGTVSVGKDVFIDINAVFIGDVKIGNNVIIESNCIIKDAVIASNVIVKANSVIDSAEIGEHCDVGPFARIRPDTQLMPRSKVGNFVEIKKSTVGEGSKISHLSYIGDTEMGADVNIGAGTITCNYDGVNKSKTIIGDDVFVGSDTQLIAPVTIGSGSNIGAGSTITKDVPEKQLSLSRAKQVSIPSWSRPKKN